MKPFLLALLALSLLCPLTAGASQESITQKRMQSGSQSIMRTDRPSSFHLSNSGKGTITKKEPDAVTLGACKSFYAKMTVLANEMKGNVPKLPYPLDTAQGGSLDCTPYPREIYDTYFATWPYPNAQLTTTPLKDDLTSCSNNSPAPEYIENVDFCRNPSATGISGIWYYFDFDQADIAAATTGTGIPSDPAQTFLVCVKQDGSSGNFFSLLMNFCSAN